MYSVSPVHYLSTVHTIALTLGSLIHLAAKNVRTRRAILRMPSDEWQPLP